MASIQRSSNSKLVLKFASSSSPNPSQSTTPSPDLSTRFVLVPHRSSNLSPELKIQYEQVFFTEIPQNPHFQPLSHLSDEFKEGVMLGWDVSFLTFVRKLRNFSDPSHFLADLKTYTDQLTEFEKMGYEVSKLRERLKVLQMLCEQDQMLKDAIHEVEEEAKERAGKAKCQEFRIQDLEEELKKATNSLASQKSNIEKTNMKKRKYVEDAAKNINEIKKFVSLPL